MAMQQLPNPNNNWLQGLVRNDIEVFVLFVNQTKRSIDLYWIDYNGVSNFYMMLGPAQQVSVNTFRSHPWMFRDVQTGERMHVKNQMIYWPVPTRARHPRNPERIVSIRQQVNIHFPLRCLLSNCLWSVAADVSSNNADAEHCVEEFAIPKTLKEQLQNVVKTIKDYRDAATEVRAEQTRR